MENERQQSTSLIQGFLRRLNDPSADRYSAIIALRTFQRGSGSAKGATRGHRHESGVTPTLDGHQEADIEACVRQAV